MQSGKIIILFAVAIALFAVLQIAESKTVDEDRKAIEKKVDDEMKKLIKRAAEEEDGHHKKGKKKKADAGKSSTTAAPGASTSKGPDGGAPGGSTAAPGASTTTTMKPSAAGGSTTTAKAGAPSTTGKPGGSTTTGKPGASTTASAKGGNTSTKNPDDELVDKVRKLQNEERVIIREIFTQVRKWKEWLQNNKNKTLNPKAAKVALQHIDQVKPLINSKPKRFYGAYSGF